MNAIALRALTMRYPDQQTAAVRDVSFDVRQGEHVAIIGASGCGKTTLLRLIAGFERAEAGHIIIEGREMDGPAGHQAPEMRRVAIVFQDLALFPHLTVRDNISFGLRRSRRAARRARVDDLLELCAITPLARRYPHELSGGQRQRVALARALAPEYPVLLLDEPLSDLDPARRAELRGELRRILKHTRVTTVLVTHDREEAFEFGERIAVMEGGRLEQYGSPRELIERPLTRSVARALGDATILPALVRDGILLTELGEIRADGVVLADGPTELLVRPYDLLLGPSVSSGSVLNERIFRGSHDLATIRLPSGREVTAMIECASSWRPGDSVTVRAVPRHIIVFDDCVPE